MISISSFNYVQNSIFNSPNLPQEQNMQSKTEHILSILSRTGLESKFKFLKTFFSRSHVRHDTLHTITTTSTATRLLRQQVSRFRLENDFRLPPDKWFCNFFLSHHLSQNLISCEIVYLLSIGRRAWMDAARKSIKSKLASSQELTRVGSLVCSLK